MSKRYAYLVCVNAGENNNKYIELIDNENGTFTPWTGRVQLTRVAQKEQPIGSWDSYLRSKTNPKKGYKDMTDLKSIKTVVSNAPKDLAKISNGGINELFEVLQGFSNKSISTNYTVKASDVTKAQVDKAQSIINELVVEMKKDWRDTKIINDLLVDLYTVIPRSMKKVIDHIFSDNDIKHDRRKCLDVISKEQDTLDVMAQQVSQNTVATDDAIDEPNAVETILDKLGLQVIECDASETKLVKTLMQGQDNLLHKVYKVINLKTQVKYNLAKAIENKTELFWHGSRNENWLSILQNGLLIRPSNAIHTGSMFGDGIYFADKFQKSFGYTSGLNKKSAYWTSGSNETAFMALFSVKTGKQKRVTRAAYNLCQRQLDQEGYDSVFAEGGADLRNNEYIIYKSDFCTVQYIIQLK